jgi:hypothetical protein
MPKSITDTAQTFLIEISGSNDSFRLDLGRYLIKSTYFDSFQPFRKTESKPSSESKLCQYAETRFKTNGKYQTGENDRLV